MIGQAVEIEDSLEADLGLSRTIEGTIFKIVLGDMEDKTAGENIGIVVMDVIVTIKVGKDQERGCSQEVIVVIEIEVQAAVGLGQDLEPVLIETE